MVNNKIYLFLNNTPEKMPVISDSSGKITAEIKSMLWSDLKDRYQNYDIDFSDFSFVYELEHRLSEQFNGYVFSVYYKGMLIHGYDVYLNDNKIETYRNYERKSSDYWNKLYYSYRLEKSSNLSN